MSKPPVPDYNRISADLEYPVANPAAFRDNNPTNEHRRFLVKGPNETKQWVHVPKVTLVGGPLAGTVVHKQVEEAEVELPVPGQPGVLARYVRKSETSFEYTAPEPVVEQVQKHPDGTKHKYQFRDGAWAYVGPA